MYLYIRTCVSRLPLPLVTLSARCTHIFTSTRTSYIANVHGSHMCTMYIDQYFAPVQGQRDSTHRCTHKQLQRTSSPLAMTSSTATAVDRARAPNDEPNGPLLHPTTTPTTTNTNPAPPTPPTRTRTFTASISHRACHVCQQASRRVVG